MMKRKIALFGGTFDPIHLGHTTVAADAAEYIGAEKIVLIPAKRSPLKRCFPKAADDDRFRMITLAISENEKFQVSDYELKKPQPNYTLETVREFQTRYGSDTSIHWLIGADTIDELPRWHRITELLDRCNVSVMYRAGWPKPDFAEFETVWGPQRIEKLQQNLIQSPLIDISSTEIRNRLAAGRSVADMLAPPALDYITNHNLYQKSEGAED